MTNFIKINIIMWFFDMMITHRLADVVFIVVGIILMNSILGDLINLAFDAYDFFTDPFILRQRQQWNNDNNSSSISRSNFNILNILNILNCWNTPQWLHQDCPITSTTDRHIWTRTKDVPSEHRATHLSQPRHIRAHRRTAPSDRDQLFKCK